MLPERIESKIDASGDCWLWTGARSRGYGYATHEGRKQPAHRVVWELLVGPISEGLQIDHLCRVRHCVNPDHLEPVPPTVNVRRGKRLNRGSCQNGHPNPEYVVNEKRGWRQCRECKRATDNRAHRAERRQAVSA